MTNIVWVVAILAACGGGVSDSSGVDSSKPITDLSDSERTTVCEWAIEVQGGAGHQTSCGDGVTVTTTTQAKCEMDSSQLPPACSSVTVAELETCVNAIGDDTCGEFFSPGSACSEYFSCVSMLVRRGR